MIAHDQDHAFEALLEFIRNARGFDFTGYKRPSLKRRITKRMRDIGYDDFGAYNAHLTEQPDEFAELFDTILINVTSFFRDDIAWDFVSQEIVPRIVQTRDSDRIRIWSTGCATGEEPFTLAMVFAEALGEDEFRRRVKIYATDVDDHALEAGRHARYTTKQLDAVPDHLREKYFTSNDTGHVFRADLRRSVIFGRHDLVQDPPISRIDLLSSRNTLMYFDTETQQQVLRDFHFALKEDGYLFLGKSEALAARTGLFAPVDLKRRVFAKVPRAVARRRVVTRPEPTVEAPRDAVEAAFDAGPVAHLMVDPEGLLVAANLQARGLFGLRQSDVGRPLKDLDVSFRPVELRSRIEQVMVDRHVITLREVEWQIGHEPRFVDVQLAPVISETSEMAGVGITFTDVTRYRRLEQELHESRRDSDTAYEELQSTVEELETTNEELQSTNEELETTNEELQSTNEELETMNEELQSTNEELEAMNDELNVRTDDLNKTNDFLDAVLSSLDAGVAVITPDLEVQAWNRGARELWGLAADEVVGQHFLNLDIGLPVDQLRGPIRTALGEGDGHPRHVQLRGVNRRGRDVEILVTLTSLRGLNGDSHGVIVMMQTVDSDSA